MRTRLLTSMVLLAAFAALAALSQGTPALAVGAASAVSQAATAPAGGGLAHRPGGALRLRRDALAQPGQRGDRRDQRRAGEKAGPHRHIAP